MLIHKVKLVMKKIRICPSDSKNKDKKYNSIQDWANHNVWVFKTSHISAKYFIIFYTILYYFVRCMNVACLQVVDKREALRTWSIICCFKETLILFILNILASPYIPKIISVVFCVIYWIKICHAYVHKYKGIFNQCFHWFPL